VISESPGRNESERIGGLETHKNRKPSLHMKGEGSIGKLNWHRLSYSDGVVAAAWCQGHTEQLEKPYLSREETFGEGNLNNRLPPGNEIKTGGWRMGL